MKQLVLRLIPLLAVCFWSQVFGQTEYNLYFSDNLYQSSLVNNTAVPDHKVSIGLPGLQGGYVGVANTGFSLSQIVVPETVDGKTKYLFDPQRFRNSLSKENMFFLGAYADLFHIRVKVRNAFLSYSSGLRTQYYFSYPLSFADFIARRNVDENGNGVDLDMSSLAVRLDVYNEHAFGFTKIGRNIVFGGKMKVLQGLMNVDFAPNTLIAGTSAQTYDYSLDSDVALRTASIIPLDINQNTGSMASNAFKNTGLATDLGIAYIIRKKLTLSANVNNLGFITWRSNTREYGLSSNLDFKGLPYVGPLLRGESIDSLSLVDSVTKFVNSTNTAGKAYTTLLIPQFYLGAKYNATPRISLSTLVYFDYYKALRVGVGLGGQLKVGRIWSLLTNTSYQYNALNYGVGFTWKPGPFQFFFMTDNISAIVDPNTAKAFNVRTGMNLVFSRMGMQQKQILRK